MVFQNHLQVNARLLQQHVSQTRGKYVTLKDIHNIRARSSKVGSDEWTATFSELQKFQTGDPASVVEIMVKDGTNDLEMIMLQSGEMRDRLAKFPEVIQLDGTYGLNQAGMPLYALVVEDADGCGKLAAVILTHNETAINIKTMLERVKHHNPALNSTQVVIVDKDFAEVNAVKEVLTNAQIQLCVFHVLKAIRKELLRTIPKQKQREAYSTMHSLVYARNAEQFDTQWHKLGDYPAFKRYMESSWLPLKKWWVQYERMSHVNLGNAMNNRIESQFGKLKQVFSRKRRMNECVRLLLTVLKSADVQGQFQRFRNKYKVAYRNGFSGEGGEYFSISTPYATNKILDQIQKANANRCETTQQDQSVCLTNVKSRESYLVSHDGSVCTCSFHKTMLLPCRHIFVVRKASGLPTVSPDLVANRWKLDMDDTPHTAVSSPVQLYGLHCPTYSGVLSRSEKYTAACRQLSKLSVAMSEVGMQDFVNITAFIAKVIERIEAGKECFLLDDDCSADEDELGPSTSTSEPQDGDNRTAPMTQKQPMQVHPQQPIMKTVQNAVPR